MAQILNSKWLFASNSPVFVEWVITINAKWAIFQLYRDKSFLERVIIFQRYHGKNKLYLMRWFPLCTRPFEHTYQSFLFILWFCMLMEEASNTNFYFYSLYFDTTRDWMYHLPHLRQPIYPLHHLCGSVSVETCFGCCSSSFSLRTNILFGFSSAMWFIIV